MPFSNNGEKRSVIVGPGLVINIDEVISQSHNSDKEYTKYPTEAGRFGFDNSVSMPESLEMTIRITDTPTSSSAQVYEDRHRVIYTQLRLWQALSAPLFVSTSLRSYTNVYITKLNPIKTKQDGYSITVNINFVEIQNVVLGLAFLVANLLVDADVAHSSTDVVDIGVF